MEPINNTSPRTELNFETNTNPTTPPITQTPENNPATPHQRKQIPLFFGISIGIALSVTGAFAFYFYQKSKTPFSNQSVQEENISTPTSTPTNTSITDAYKVTWLDKPQEIASLNVFNQTKEFSDDNAGLKIYFDKVKYYLVANLGDGSQLINIFLPKQEGPGDYDFLFRVIKTQGGQLSIIKPQNDYDLEQISKFLNPTITINSINFSELQPPENLDINNTSFKKSYTYNKTFDSLSNPELVKSTEYGDLYIVYTPRVDVETISDLYTKSFYLRLKDWTLYNYNQKYGFVSDNKTVWFTWDDGSTTGDNQFYDTVHGGGCGSGLDGSTIIKNDSPLIKDKIIIASNVSTTYNKPFYQIKDTNNSFVKKLYELYKSTSQYITPAVVPDINSFANAKNHFLYQDFSGDWVIFTNQKYAIQAECGKPVIYLYPTKETQVKVQVGAQITKSEPTYPSQGWLVTAKPNGELTYQNQSYPYLFWEGLGNGIYPDYQNRGTVVAQRDLVSTLYKQLSKLGLNQKESADFMEFWQPKLPKTPYVRLTWLNTKDMDVLAPLNVSPKPDTSIRIFLEFQGLEKPITLKPQKLTAPPRNGFTLIEWGGLLLKARE